eukprot:scaffold321789_cov30-Tisochrysis_lutea.AAC.3
MLFGPNASCPGSEHSTKRTSPPYIIAVPSLLQPSMGKPLLVRQPSAGGEAEPDVAASAMHDPRFAP